MSGSMSWNQKKFLWLFIIAGVTLVLDQWTKQLILDNFRWGESKVIWEHIFNLTYVRNKGAAFGLMNDAPEAIRKPFFLAVPVIAVGIIGFIYWRLQASQKWVAVALSLVFGGAIGNLIDRARFGYVVDFLDVNWKEVYHWPAFNIADSAIVIGVGMLFIDSFRAQKEQSSS